LQTFGQQDIFQTAGFTLAARPPEPVTHVHARRSCAVRCPYALHALMMWLRQRLSYGAGWACAGCRALLINHDALQCAVRDDNPAATLRILSSNCMSLLRSPYIAHESDDMPSRF
jgi:hypothetical protein